MEMLIESLINQFSLKNLRKFFEEKLRIELKEEEDVLPREDYEEYFGKLYVLKPYGKENIKLKDDTIAIYAIESKKELSERSSKKRQFGLATELIDHKKGRLEDGGFFVFYDKKGNFRFSFVHKIYEGAKHKFSHYKRYTYFVQKGKPYRTFKEALLELQLDSIGSITKAFAVQPLIKEFYKEIQNWYAWALKDNKVWFPGGTKEENLIRLITRLIFVWFLKEMKLVPEEIFDEERLKDIVKDFGEKDYYYNAILQNLFFATLNREIGKREFAKEGDFLQNRTHFGVKNLYRYQSFLKIPPEDFIKLFEKTPFINGGLFECLDEDSQYVDGFSREESKRAKIPDEFFFLDERTEDLSYFYGTNARREKVRGLINILKDYNFTADENSPVDVEVSLDPELLGHIFENLLASYNEETQTTARKATGSYYTPKEIVDFMVEESLKEYLRTKTGIEEGSVERLFGFEESVELSEEERHKILKAIDEIKVLDPAVGSGAFPMGVLHKLVYLLERIDPNNELWYELQYQKALKEAKDILRIENKDTREELLKELNENFDEAITYPDYARKLYILQNSIYGVDIQNIAIQITKLRFFLSLIIDQKPDPSKENLGIKPLPHLETNFITANTLIGLETSRQYTLGDDKLRELKRELKKLYKKHFSIRSREEKKRIQEKAEEIRKKIKEELKKLGFSNEDLEKIVKFDIFDQLARADWFDPEWMFGVDDGFDIVIGNPPYVRQEKIKNLKPDLQKQKYEVFTSTADLYVYFYEKGYQLLKQKGILAYITSNKWMRTKYGENLRKFLKEKTTIIKLIDFGGYRVFEQTVDTCILLFKKEKPPKGHTFEFLTVPSDVEDLENFLENANWQKMEQEKLSNNGWTLGDDKVLSLKEKIEKVGKPLKEWDVKIYRGVLTGFNEAFIITTEKRNEILANCKDEEERRRTEEIIKPILRGRDIGRYYYKWAGLWLIKIEAGWTNKNRGKLDPETFFKSQFPALYDHLMSFKDYKGKGKGLFARDDKGDYWWELRHCDYYPEFEKEKIVWQRVTKQFSFCLVPAGLYILDSMAFLVGENLKYILGILNSKLIDFYVKTYVHLYGDTGFLLSNQYVERIPIPPITPQTQPLADQIVQKVQEILTLTQSPDFETSQEKQQKVKELEREIDQLVYELYELTEEEIRIVEGEG
ncbi:MAG: Eco57I restriction-modification methylase domain-containing protein [Aquificaceae bacterium]|nr:Eco57I restriction-modification methylase domain-containing protein [Aquificaceae bacterium]